MENQVDRILLASFEIGWPIIRSHKIVFEGRKFAFFTLFGSHERTIGLFCFGAVAQLEERLICIQEVVGSIPIGSTILSS